MKKKSLFKIKPSSTKKVDNCYKIAMTPAYPDAYFMDPKTKDADLQLTLNEKAAKLNMLKECFIKTNH